MVKPISEKELEKKIAGYEKDFKKELNNENLNPILDKVINSSNWARRFQDPNFEKKCIAIREKHQSYLSQNSKTQSNAKEYDSHEHRRNIAIVLKNASTIGNQTKAHSL